MFTFKIKYFFLAILLFVTEVLIAVYITDNLVRPYGGDFLVVILIYCFVKAFWTASVPVAAISVLIFSYIIEVSQYFKLVKLIGLQNSKLANVVLGNSFAWADMLAYTLGILLVILLEKLFQPDVVKTEKKS